MTDKEGEVIGMADVMESGFVIGVPMQNSYPPKSNASEASSIPYFNVVGFDSQIVEVTLHPSQSILTEPGNLVHMHDCFLPKISSGGFGAACRRCCCAGESFYRVIYTNQSDTHATIALTPPFPAKVIPINLDQVRGLTIKSRAFLASLDTKCDIRLKMVRSAGVACFGGQGLLLNQLKGRGWVFLNAAGTVMHKILRVGERLVVDTHSLVAFENTCTYEIKLAGDCCMVCCGGQGIFNTLMTGPGLVIVQSMSIEKMAAALGAGGGGGDNGGSGN